MFLRGARDSSMLFSIPFSALSTQRPRAVDLYGPKAIHAGCRGYRSSSSSPDSEHFRMLRKYGHDNVWGLFYVGKEAELPGCRKIICADNGSPNVEDFVIKTWEDFGRLPVPGDVTAHPAFEEELKCIDILRREVGGKRPICAYITATMTIPALLMGMESWMNLLFCGPADVRDELLAKGHEFFVKETAAYRKAGADVIVHSNPFESTDMVSMNYFKEHSLPWIEKDVKRVTGDHLAHLAKELRCDVIITCIRQVRLQSVKGGEGA